MVLNTFDPRTQEAKAGEFNLCITMEMRSVTDFCCCFIFLRIGFPCVPLAVLELTL